MPESLQGYVPPEATNKVIKLDESLFPVVQRIARLLPAEKVWELFSSTASETGGVIKFPYLRGTAMFDRMQNNLALIQNAEAVHAIGDIPRYYQRMSECAMRVLLWVDIGFEGLENLAASPASNNWESVKTDGKRMYNEWLKRFVQFRNKYTEKDSDCFAQYGLEYLLDRWQKK